MDGVRGVCAGIYALTLGYDSSCFAADLFDGLAGLVIVIRIQNVYAVSFGIKVIVTL